MGFGIVVAGTALLLLDRLALDFVGCIVACYGFFLAAQKMKGVYVSFAFSLAAAVLTGVRSLRLLGVVEIGDIFVYLDGGIYICIGLSAAALCAVIASFASKNSGHGLCTFAQVTLYLAILIPALKAGVTAFPATEFSEMFKTLALVLYYVFLVLYLVFTFDVYASVTTPQLIRKQEEENKEYEQKRNERREKIRRLMRGGDGDDKE